MGECRFEGKDWQGDEYTCRTHKGEDPVLCTHAAADLERRVAEQKALTENAWKVANDQAKQREALEQRVETAERRAFKGEYEATWPATDERATIRDLESRLVNLEEEKTWADYDVRNATEQRDTTERQLAQAEAHEAAMRSGLSNLVNRLNLVHSSEEYKAVWYLYATHTVGGYRGPSYEQALNEANTALSPDAGRAPQEHSE